MTIYHHKNIIQDCTYPQPEPTSGDILHKKPKNYWWKNKVVRTVKEVTGLFSMINDNVSVGIVWLDIGI